MATGPEHYREAERLLARARQRMPGMPAEEQREAQADLVQESLAHAVLAVAAGLMLTPSADTQASQPAGGTGADRDGPSA